MDCVISGEYEFGGIGHILSIKSAGARLDIEVTNGLTNEVWQATFEASFIENMTKKTGNFKQFPVFVNMLRSAVLKTTDSVWLDLLSFADLEKLRAKKTGVETSLNSQASNANASQFNRRYLILMYNVEFDRIHFPLPLSPIATTASSDASHVHAVVVRELQSEMKMLRNQLNSDYRIVGYEELKRNYERVVEEKRALEDGYRQLQEECQVLTHEGSAKQVRMLKNVIRQLEQDIGEVKAKHQHIIARKDKDIKALSEEVEELRSSERSLKSRLKSSLQELQSFKRYGSRNNSMQSLNECDNVVNRSGLSRPSPRQPRNVGGSLSARDYASTYSAVRSNIVRNNGIHSARVRSNSRESARDLRQRSSSRSPSASRIPVRLPPNSNDLQLSARSRRSSKGERPLLPQNRFSSRSPSPALRTNGRGISNSGTKNHSHARTPSVSSIASNNSDLSLVFGNNSMNNSQRQAENRGMFLRRAPVAKATAAATAVNRHIPRRDIPMLRQQRVPFMASAIAADSSENYLDKSYVDDIPTSSKAMPKSIVDRPLVENHMHNRAAEMLEIDARLKRLHSLLKESDLSV